MSGTGSAASVGVGTLEAPAPWSLAGHGYIVLLKPARGRDGEDAWTPRELAGQQPGGPGLLMYVDYQTSGVGPYKELLYIPGRFRHDGEHRWSITRIVVSTAESVRAGHQNWGIPKEIAEFETRRTDGGGEAVRVIQDGATLAELEFGPAGLRLPGGGALLPAALRRIVQFEDQHRFRFTPSAGGPVAWSRLDRLVTDEARFPALGPEDALMCLAAPDFRMTFPVADVDEAAD